VGLPVSSALSPSLPPVVAADLGSVAAHPHVTPAAAAAPVDKEPTATGALPQPVELSTGQELGSRTEDRPEHSVQRKVTIVPTPGKASLSGSNLQTRKGLGEYGVQLGQGLRIDRLIAHDSHKELAKRLPQRESLLQNVGRFVGTQLRFLMQTLGLLTGEDIGMMAPGHQVGVAMQEFLGLVRTPVFHRVYEIEAQFTPQESQISSVKSHTLFPGQEYALFLTTLTIIDGYEEVVKC
jgi:hypothetical protein